MPDQTGQTLLDQGHLDQGHLDQDHLDHDRAPDTEQLWRAFADRLRRFIAARVSAPDAADDILQDVFLRIHRRGDTLRDADRTTSWVFQITRNAIIDHYRSAPRRREVPVRAIDGDIAAGTGDDDADLQLTYAVRSELAACLQPLLQQLPPMYRHALEMVEVEGLTQTQAAARAGLSVSGMKSRVQRGRARLHRTLHECCDIEVDARGGPVGCTPGAGDGCAP